MDELLSGVEVGGEQEQELLRSKPFLGVPFSCKDCFAAENMAHTVGLYSRDGDGYHLSTYYHNLSP